MKTASMASLTGKHVIAIDRRASKRVTNDVISVRAAEAPFIDN